MRSHLQREHSVELGKAKITRVFFAKKYVEDQAVSIYKSEEKWNRNGRNDINEELEDVFATVDIYDSVDPFDAI